MKYKFALFIFFICIIIYSNSLGGELVYDDDYFIVKNIYIRNLANIPSFFLNRSAAAFGGLSEDIYRPLATFSYALDYFFWILNPLGYHLSNVLIHSFNAVLLFLFLYAVFKNIYTALVSALLFACHPIQTEVVSWVAGRSSLLCMLFYMISLITYLRFSQSSDKRYYFASLISYAASLFSKEMAITLPLILILYDIHFPVKGLPIKKTARYTPYFVITLFFVMVRMSVVGKMAQCGWWDNSLYHTYLTMLRVLVKYIGLLILPIKQCVNYSIDISKSIIEPRVIFSIFALILILLSTILIFRKHRKASFFIWWFFITLLPVCNFIPIKTLMAERFLYLPSIGFFAILGIALSGMRAWAQHPFRIGTTLSVIITALLIMTYSLLTTSRNKDWNSSMAMSKSLLKIYPLSAWAYASLGSSYIDMGNYNDAVSSLKKAIILSKNYITPRNELGFCYLEMARYEDAVKVLEAALAIAPNDLETINSLGVAYANLGRYDKAIEEFNLLIKIDPGYVKAYLNLGTAYENKLEYQKAIEEYTKIEKHTNAAINIAVSYIRMGNLYWKMGSKNYAKECYKKVIDKYGRDLEEVKKIALEKLKSLDKV